MSKNSQRRPFTALELRCTAGCAPERRGSALLIVIGTLALVAVFAAVYVSIGRTDRRAANALKTRIEQRDNSINVGDYLAGVIGDDRLDAIVQYDVNLQPFGRRELVDVPYTDWTRRSEVNLGNSADEAVLFTPTGAPFRMDGLTALTDYRVANDPWLASTTPTFLGNPGDPFSGNDLRPFSNFETFENKFPNSKNFLDHRDWLQISNFALDGRPVNLFNLRPNLATGFNALGGASAAVGGFDSEPGFGISPRADGRPIRRMSNYLSLLNQEVPGDPESLIQAFDPDVAGVWIPGYNDPQNVGLSGLDLYNTPAVWTMYQRFMLMPMNQPFVIKNRNGDESSWADPDFPYYQYADADGDGFADSRWFELRSARDAGEGSGAANREDIESLYEQGDYRYFIAARAVDLSSMVNVNTATDQLVPPTLEYPLGLTPADVDLRRLLTMQDQAGDYTSYLQMGGAGTSAIALSLGAAHRPYIANDEPQYGPTTPTGASGFEERNVIRKVTDYWNYKHQWDGAPQDPRKLSSESTAMLIGRYAYDAIKRSINLGGTLSNDYKGYDLGFGGASASARTDLLEYQVDPLDITLPLDQIDQEKRFEQYMRVGRLDPVNPALSSALTDATNAYGSGLYGLDDLTELLTYHGLNDPDFTSRLERVADGRYSSPLSSGVDDALQTRRLGPLFSNRPLTLDRFQHGLALTDINDNPNTPPTYDNPGLREINGRVSFNSMAMLSLSPRRRMTTISGFVPISPDERLTDAALPVAMTGASVLQPLSDVMTNANALFGIYAGALAGEFEDMRSLAWENDISLNDTFEYSTMFYGHRGPELALRIAAHAAVNMKDIADADQTPTVATLLVDNNRRNDLTSTANFPTDANMSQPSNQWYRDYPGRAAGLLFDIEPDPTRPDTVLADSELDVQRQAINVYGTEATPVITEVTTFYLYTDASESAGGDMDYLDDVRPSRRPNGLVGPIPDDDDLRRITINGDDDIAGNADLLMKCIAFQLHNPWDEAISLGGEGRNSRDPLTRMRDPSNEDIIDASTDQYEFSYYIEWNGYFFKLAEFQRYYAPDVNGDSTRTVDQTLSGVPNPGTSIGPNGGYLDPTMYPDFLARNVVMAPGETRTFYAIADPSFDSGTNELTIEAKWRAVLDAYGDLPPTYVVGTGTDGDMDGLIDGTDGKGWTGPAQEWLINQFIPRAAVFSVDDRIGLPIMIHPMSPQTGEYLDDAMVYDYFSTSGPQSGPMFDQIQGATGRNDSTEARLWKKITTPAEEENDTRFTNRITQNLLHNDLLVDRFSVTGVAQSLPAGDQEVENTVSFEEDYPDSAAEIAANARNDNTGYSILRWHTSTTKDSYDPDLNYMGQNFDVVGEEAGQVREWLLRTRQVRSDAIVNVEDSYTAPLTIEDFRDVTGAAVGTDIFTGYNAPAQSDFEVHIQPRDMFQVDPVIVTAALPPFRKTETRILEVADTNGGNPADKFGRDAGMAEWVHPDPSTVLHQGDTLTSRPASVPTDLSANNLRPQIMSNSVTLANAQRLADLLLPWGIGATYAPNSPGSLVDNNANYYADEWMTFTESLAIALGYEDPSPAAMAADSIWASTWDNAVNIEERVLDDGHLSLDRYVAYINADPTESPAEFTVHTDILRGSGVPMAMGVLDRARAIAPLNRVTDPLTASGTQPPEYDLTRATFGTININTAPVEVLRLLPGLTPSRVQYATDNTGGSVAFEWWGAQYPNTMVPDNTLATAPDDLIQNPDVAAAIVAYRDRIYGIPNTAARPEPFGVSYYAAPAFIGVSTPNLPSMLNNLINEDPSLGTVPTNVLDRRTFTGIDGLRQTPGFGSLGELLAVQIDPQLESTNLAAWLRLRHLSIQQLGHDARAQGIVNEITILPQVFAGNVVGSTVDDYAEKLAMADGVVNMLSVRSDYYAVWFVLQGYKESDVANLRPEDPLIPSVHKRYLMVVDRSNVIEPGDKPKIVLLKEVPL